MVRPSLRPPAERIYPLRGDVLGNEGGGLRGLSSRYVGHCRCLPTVRLTERPWRDMEVIVSLARLSLLSTAGLPWWAGRIAKRKAGGAAGAR